MAARIQLNRAGVREQLRSDAMMQTLRREARRFQSHPDIEMESFTGRNRARVTLRTQSFAGREALKRSVGK